MAMFMIDGPRRGSLLQRFILPGLSLITRLLASAVLRQAALVLTGCALVLIQGHTAAQAAELPQVLSGVNARFQGANLPVVTGNNMVINQFADKATLQAQLAAAQEEVAALRAMLAGGGGSGPPTLPSVAPEAPVKKR